MSPRNAYLTGVYCSASNADVHAGGSESVGIHDHVDVAVVGHIQPELSVEVSASLHILVTKQDGGAAHGTSRVAIDHHSCKSRRYRPEWA